MNLFEAGMLICFGISWPFAIAKTIRAKNPTGKSYLFSSLIILGYISGCINKIINHFDWVFWIYVLDLLLVSTDMVLCLWYQHKNKRSVSGKTGTVHD